MMADETKPAKYYTPTSLMEEAEESKESSKILPKLDHKTSEVKTPLIHVKSSPSVPTLKQPGFVRRVVHLRGKIKKRTE